MTQIYFFVNSEIPILFFDQDTRSPRELVKLINTGAMRLGKDEVKLRGERLWARAHPPLHIVTVIRAVPPVDISPRMYDVLYGIADGKRAGQIAGELGIARRTVYEYTALLKARFGLLTKEEVVDTALELGILCTYFD